MRGEPAAHAAWLPPVQAVRQRMLLSGCWVSVRSGSRGASFVTRNETEALHLATLPHP